MGQTLNKTKENKQNKREKNKKLYYTNSIATSCLIKKKLERKNSSRIKRKNKYTCSAEKTHAVR